MRERAIHLIMNIYVTYLNFVLPNGTQRFGSLELEEFSKLVIEVSLQLPDISTVIFPSAVNSDSSSYESSP